MNSFDKSIEWGHEILPIIFDGASTNVKLFKTTKKALSPKINGKPTLAAQLKLETSCFRKGQEFFLILCIPRVAKTLRNALFAKRNYFSYPKLTLSFNFFLEAGTCIVKWTRDLHHKIKEKIVSSHRMPKM